MGEKIVDRHTLYVGGTIEGNFSFPQGGGVVLFAHACGSSRHSHGIDTCRSSSSQAPVICSANDIQRSLAGTLNSFGPPTLRQVLDGGLAANRLRIQSHQIQ